MFLILPPYSPPSPSIWTDVAILLLIDLSSDTVQPQILVTPLIILHLYPLSDIGILAVLDVLLLAFNYRATTFVGTGPTKELDRGWDMMMVKCRSSLSAMVCSPPSKCWYSTDNDLGVPNSDRPLSCFFPTYH